MPTQVRWICPNNLHPGVLGPTRPRKDNIVRYCLPCSLKAGKLVERVAPALQKKRSERQVATESRAKKRQDRIRSQARKQTHIPVREIDGSSGEVDVRRTLKRMMKLAIIDEYASKYYWGDLPRVNVRYSRHKPYSSGHAYVGSEITVTIGVGAERIEVEELLLHELIHVILPHKEWHGSMFQRVLSLAAREWWPGIQVRADAGKYKLDENIINEVKRIAIEEKT